MRGGQSSHTAILFVLVMAIVGIAALMHASDDGGSGERSPAGSAWVCNSNFDSLSCFLASLSR